MAFAYEQRKDKDMAVRIVGINIPEEKRVEISLRYIYGIGPAHAKKICGALKFAPSLRTKDLTDEQVIEIQRYIEGHFKVEGDVRRETTMNIKRLQDLKTYRGIRHRNRLPVRGQRTQTNARTRKGKRVVVSGSSVKGK
jgi:small subunit ribosomal protein S13